MLASIIEAIAPAPQEISLYTSGHSHNEARRCHFKAELSCLLLCAFRALTVADGVSLGQHAAIILPYPGIIPSLTRLRYHVEWDWQGLNGLNRPLPKPFPWVVFIFFMLAPYVHTCMPLNGVVLALSNRGQCFLSDHPPLQAKFFTALILKPRLHAHDMEGLV